MFPCIYGGLYGLHFYHHSISSFNFTGSVLESILSLEACKMGLPTLDGLLSHPFFADETVTTVGIKPQLKVSIFTLAHEKKIITHL